MARGPYAPAERVSQVVLFVKENFSALDTSSLAEDLPREYTRQVFKVIGDTRASANPYALDVCRAQFGNKCPGFFESWGRFFRSRSADDQSRQSRRPGRPCRRRTPHRRCTTRSG